MTVLCYLYCKRSPARSDTSTPASASARGAAAASAVRSIAAREAAGVDVTYQPCHVAHESFPRTPAAFEPMDLVFEATGYARHAFETVDALAANGVGALLGISTDWTFEIDGGRLHREFVLENKALVGSVNSHVPHFDDARESLAAYPNWFTDAVVTDVFSPEGVDTAFETGDDRIKTVVEFGTR